MTTRGTVADVTSVTSSTNIGVSSITSLYPQNSTFESTSLTGVSWGLLLQDFMKLDVGDKVGFQFETAKLPTGSSQVAVGTSTASAPTKFIILYMGPFEGTFL